MSQLTSFNFSLSNQVCLSAICDKGEIKLRGCALRTMTYVSFMLHQELSRSLPRN